MENDQSTKELAHPVVTPTCVTMAAEVNERQNTRLWKQVCLNGESPFLLINVLNLFFLRTIFIPYVCHANSKKSVIPRFVNFVLLIYHYQMNISYILNESICLHLHPSLG